MGNIRSRIIFNSPKYYDESADENILDHLIYLKNSLGNVIYLSHIDNKADYTILFSHGNAENIFSAI
jgi:hypothetical protein